jgi:hypothetical protein
MVPQKNVCVAAGASATDSDTIDVEGKGVVVPDVEGEGLVVPDVELD